MIQSSKSIARALLPGLVSASLLVLAGQPAAAVDSRSRIVAPYEVASALQRLRLRPLASPWQRGRFWIAPAMARDGTPVRVVIEARSGRVIDVSEIEDAPPRPRRPVAGPPAAPGPRVVMRDGRVDDPARHRDDTWADLDEEESGPYGPRVVPGRSLPPPAVQKQIPARQPRIATRPADPKPRATPLPKPRPDELAKSEPAPATPPAAAPPAAEKKPEAFPPAQGFE